MIKLTPLLSESVLDMYSKLDEYDCIRLIKKHAMQSYNNIIIEKNYIYRGINTNTDYFYVDSMKSKRESLVASGDFKSNFYTLILDDVFTKNGYPNRSNAVVCTTNEGIAKYFGRSIVYYVIPYDNVKLGICPSSDIWSSFIDMSLREVNELLEAIHNSVLAIHPASKKVLPSDYYKYTLNDIKKLWVYKNKYKKEIEHNLKDKIFINYVIFNAVSFEEFMKLFNIKDAGFQMTSVTTFDKTPYESREIWFNGKAILIHEFTINNIIEKMK